MKKKTIFLFPLLLIVSMFYPQKIYAEEAKNNNVSEITIQRARVRQISKTENVQCYSSKYGSYAITIYMDGTATLDSNGNVVSDNLNISYVCRFPFKASYSKNYRSSIISFCFDFVVTYPDNTKEIILTYLNI